MSYKYQVHQHLYGNDGYRELVFCVWLFQNHTTNSNLSNIVFRRGNSKPIEFLRDRIGDTGQLNQHLMNESNFQERFGVSVLDGIFGRKFVPIFLQGQFTGLRYLE